MPTPWLKKIKERKTLIVFDNAGAWSGAVPKAITAFNALAFPVTLETTKDENKADIVLKLVVAADSHTWKSSFYGDTTIKTPAGFRPDFPHGYTYTLTDPDRDAVAFAVTFLPGKLNKPTEGLKIGVIVHELIHGCGVDGGTGGGKKAKSQDHDSEGIMYDIMSTEGGGLIEGNHRPDMKPMPPIRVGAKTIAHIQRIWGD